MWKTKKTELRSLQGVVNDTLPLVCRCAITLSTLRTLCLSFTSGCTLWNAAEHQHAVDGARYYIAKYICYMFIAVGLQFKYSTVYAVVELVLFNTLLHFTKVRQYKKIPLQLCVDTHTEKWLQSIVKIWNGTLDFCYRCITFICSSAAV